METPAETPEPMPADDPGEPGEEGEAGEADNGEAENEGSGEDE